MEYVSHKFWCDKCKKVIEVNCDYSMIQSVIVEDPSINIEFNVKPELTCPYCNSKDHVTEIKGYSGFIHTLLTRLSANIKGFELISVNAINSYDIQILITTSTKIKFFRFRKSRYGYASYKGYAVQPHEKRYTYKFVINKDSLLEIPLVVDPVSKYFEELKLKL